MKRFRATILPALLLILCGCRTEPVAKDTAPVPAMEPPSPQYSDFAEHVRDNSASLLHDLLKDEANLNKLLLIKWESKELEELVKNISATARRGATQLEQLANEDRTLDLRATSLPSGEVETRKAITETKGRELLKAKGADLQYKLLLTQIEALNYGAHLAKVAAAHEQHPGRQRTFADLSATLLQLYEQVIDLLQRTKPNQKTS